MKILLVDDDLDLLEITAKRLQKKGYEVLTAPNLAEGARLFQSQRDAICGVICDLFLGEENGVDFFESLKASLNKTPFIIATGDELGDHRIGQYSKPGNGFWVLSKPYSMEDVIGLLKNHGAG